MVTLADFSDTQFLMTCKRCEQTLQEGDRFCRYCGQDQMEGDPSAVIDITQPASNGDDQAATPLAVQRAARRDAWRQPSSPQDSAPQNVAPDGRPGGTVAPRRWSMGLAAAVLIGLAMALSYDLYLSHQEESTRRAEQQLRAGRDRPAAAVPTEPAAPASAPASASAPAGSPKTPAPPAATAGGSVKPEASTSDASTASASAQPPAAEPPAPAPVTPVSTAPAATSAAPPAAAPGAEASSQGACPPAMAAMALCVNR